MSCANQMLFCRAQMRECDHIGHESDCPLHCADCRQTKGRVPDIELATAMYRKFHGQELSSHCRSVLTELRRFCRVMGIKPSDPIDSINYDTVEKYISTLTVKNVSKIGACYRLQAFCGRRERIAYRKAGFDVRSIDVPSIEDDSRAYKSATDEQVLKVLSWYRGLMFEKDTRARIFAMMMFRYAMRNGDVARLRWMNFRTNGGQWQLDYVPHKTEKSTAGRSVKIWLNSADQVELMAYRGAASNDEFVLPRKFGSRHVSIREMMRRLNVSLRAIGFSGSKGLYELRKMCIDKVYHLMGAEAASAYSGDDFKTIKFHYADTSSMNLHGIGDDVFGQRVR